MKITMVLVVDFYYSFFHPVIFQKSFLKSFNSAQNTGLCLFFFFFFFFLSARLVGSQFPDQGSNPGSTAVKALSLNHWTARGFPRPVSLQYFPKALQNLAKASSSTTLSFVLSSPAIMDYLCISQNDHTLLLSLVTSAQTASTALQPISPLFF